VTQFQREKMFSAIGKDTAGCLALAVTEISTVRLHRSARRMGSRSQREAGWSRVWLEMSVDAQVLHATADIPILGRLSAVSFTSGLRQIIERTFQKKLQT
jgi:hypothetical protein